MKIRESYKERKCDQDSVVSFKSKPQESTFTTQIIDSEDVDKLNVKVELEEVSDEKIEDNGILKKPVFVDVGILVKSGDLIEPNFSAFMTTEKELSTVTGIENFKILNTLINIVKIVDPRMSSYTGKLTVRDRIILTFMKLKQNVSYAFLAVLFKSCSERHIPNVICNVLDILGISSKHAIVFPTKSEISKNIPSCFEQYKNVTLILDCTEIEVQKPQNFCDQLLMYSFYCEVSNSVHSWWSACLCQSCLWRTNIK